MSLHPALETFANLSLESVGLSVASNAATALADLTVATDVVTLPTNVAALHHVLSRALSILNNSSKNFALRLSCLECLYRLSQPAVSSFRTGQLANTVQGMTAGVEEMLSRSGPNAGAAEGLASAWEMFTVLVFRITNYDVAVCRLLLQHTADGDSSAVVQTLLRIAVLHRSLCEWPLLMGVVQSLYELTVPASYYAAAEEGGGVGADLPMQSFTVESFQEKIQRLVHLLRETQALEQLCSGLRLSWHESSQGRSSPALAQGETGLNTALGPLGHIDVIDTVQNVTSAQGQELLQWLSVLGVLSRAVQNMVEFSDDAAAAKSLRTSLLQSAATHDFMANVVVPAVVAALHVWTLDSADAGGRQTLLPSCVGLLRLLRFALYKPAAGCTTPLLSALAGLARHAQTAEPKLRGDYAGMQVLLLIVESLTNVDATVVTAPVDLASAYTSLVNTIAMDKTRGTLVTSSAAAMAGVSTEGLSSVTVAAMFYFCLTEEASSFCETGGPSSGNASVRLLYCALAAEAAAAQQATAQCAAELVMLQTQLDVLQNFFLLLTLSDMLNAGPDDGAEAMRRAWGSGSGQAAQRPSLSISNASAPGGEKRSRRASHQHPAQYRCDLTGKLMREPIVLRNGHRFENDALQRVIAEVGHVDPISGEAIEETVEVDTHLQRKIAAYRVQRAAEKKRAH